MINGEKKGTGTYNGQSVVLDPPLDTLTPSRIDSTRVRVGPAVRELYGVSYRDGRRAARVATSPVTRLARASLAARPVASVHRG